MRNRLVSHGTQKHSYKLILHISLTIQGSDDEKQLVIGGEAVLVGDFVDETILFTRSWPDGAVTAERLWSQGDFNITKFIPRLNELRCRMLDFGLNAKPLNEPNNCLQLLNLYLN
ncbi:unnamed protein product [Trichobilharzia regenti]|nr:unnamed protein product [Trichobilharzia regenti]